MKTGAAALTELTDAMKKGLVKTDKLFPFLEDLLRRNAEPGLATARLSAMAEKNRFQNLWREGEENFAMGGGQEGMALFWRQMQLLGQWFKDNGAWLGEKFKGFMLWMDLFRVSIKEFFEFFATGEQNDLSVFLAQWGINLGEIRDSIIALVQSIEGMFMSGAGDASTLKEAIKARVQQFALDLKDVIDSTTKFFTAISGLIVAMQEWSSMPWWKKVSILGAVESGKVLYEGGKAAVSGIGVIKDMGDTVTNAVGISARQDITDYSLSGAGGGRYGLNSPDQALTGLNQELNRDYYRNNNPANWNNHTPAPYEVNVNFKMEGDKEALDLFVTEKLKADVQKQLESALIGAPKIK